MGSLVQLLTRYKAAVVATLEVISVAAHTAAFIFDSCGLLRPDAGVGTGKLGAACRLILNTWMPSAAAASRQISDRTSVAMKYPNSDIASTSLLVPQ